MSDRIAVMRGGRFEQIGTPEEIYDEPKTHYVAQFIGRSTILDGTVESVGRNTAVIRGACGSFRVDASRALLIAEESCEVCVRTERMRASSVPIEGFDLPATVRERDMAGGASDLCHAEKRGGSRRHKRRPPERRAQAGQHGLPVLESGAGRRHWGDFPWRVKIPSKRTNSARAR